MSIRFPATKGKHLYCFVVSRTPGFEVSYFGAGIGIVHSRYDHMITNFPHVLYNSRVRGMITLQSCMGKEVLTGQRAIRIVEP